LERVPARFTKGWGRRRCSGVMSRWFVRMGLGGLRGLLGGRRQHGKGSGPWFRIYITEVRVVLVFVGEYGALRRKSELSTRVKRKCHPRCASMGAGIGSF
jgi:hypothetical protein